MIRPLWNNVVFEKAVAADGTLYAAVKTSYDSSGYPKIALLVRRPNGVWDIFKLLPTTR